MADQLEMLVAHYENALEAEQMYQTLRAAHIRNELHAIDAAVLVKDKDGKTRVMEEDDMEGREGRTVGAIVGGMMGLALGPGGGLLGAAIGGAIGVAAGALAGNIGASAIDSGMSNKTINRILEQMPNSTSTIIVLAEDDYRAKIKAIIGNAPNAKVKRFALTLAVGEELD